MGKQPLFGRQASTKTCQFSACPNDSMTRDDDRNRVGAVGSTHSSTGFGLVYFFCNVSVGGGLAVFDLPQCLPDALLKISTLRGQWNSKGGSSTREILLQLSDGFCEFSMYVLPVGGRAE